jgi:hypothetical protein
MKRRFGKRNQATVAELGGNTACWLRFELLCGCSRVTVVFKKNGHATDVSPRYERVIRLMMPLSVSP